jgi:hypothetical protein
MKKLVAAICCILALQSFSQVKPEAGTSVKAEGRRVLIKALAVIVNTEGNRKMPSKRVNLPNSERPPF